MMKTINQFDDQGNFIFWEDSMADTDMVRRGFMSQKVVDLLIEWVTKYDYPLAHFPVCEVSREQWGAILAAHQDRTE